MNIEEKIRVLIENQISMQRNMEILEKRIKKVESELEKMKNITPLDIIKTISTPTIQGLNKTE